MEQNTHDEVVIRELIGWGFDENEHRPSLEAQSDAIDFARSKIGSRKHFTTVDPIVKETPASVTDLMAEQLLRPELHTEMQGLNWRTGIVDLRHLLAFQRRLIFDPEHPHPVVPAPNAWPALTALAFGPPISPTYTTVTVSPQEIWLQTTNPNLQLRQAAIDSTPPIALHGGSPFFEVAEYRGRWFLRDGYHRAHMLLCANIFYLPAVIIHARTLVELGPIGHWFFSEEILFGPTPPRITDFLDDQLTIEYTRRRMLKTIRVTIEESFAPVAPILSAGDSL